MIKLLLLAVGVWFVFTILKKYARSVDRDDERDVTAPPAHEDMVRCAQCGVHLPKSEGILSRGEFYCSDEHRRLHQG